MRLQCPFLVLSLLIFLLLAIVATWALGPYVTRYRSIGECLYEQIQVHIS